MTQDEKVALLKEAGVWDVIGFPGCIDKLIDLVAANESEALAEQAEREPVANVRVRALRGNESVPKIDVEWLTRPTPGFLYAAPVSIEAAVLAEREACAKVVEAGVFGHGECAAAIRARGEKL